MKTYKCPKCGSTDISILATIKQGEMIAFEKAVNEPNHKAVRCNKCNLFIKPVEEEPLDTIPTNTYRKINTPNPLAVKGICEAFLSKCVWNIFHPVSDGLYRCKHYYIRKHKKENKFFGFCDDNRDKANYDYMRIYDCDVKEAIKILKEKGYHLFRVYEYRTWEGYRVSEKAYMDNGIEVTDFNGSID